MKRSLALITDRTLLSPQWTLAQAVAPAITGGVDLVIFRETDLPENPRLTLARFVLEGAAGRAAVITSGEASFALKVGAAGLFVEEGPKAVKEAREALGRQAIVGALLRSTSEAAEAAEYGADFGLLNLDWTQSDSALESVRATSSCLPIIAGVDPPMDLVERILQAGATGVAVCECGMRAYDRTSACRAYRSACGVDGSANPA